MKHLNIYKISLSIIIIITILISAGCGVSKTQKPDEITEPKIVTETEIILTLEELSEYDGQDDNPAYIAVDGIIYDVTKVRQWFGGKHMGFTAGMDVTDEINDSPHGIVKLKGVPIIGKLAD